jgi:predicted alpha-1,2-mannosidase
MKNILTVAALFLIAHTSVAQPKTPADFVNPFIGTKNMGHTFPGACVPFGLVQLSPETDTVMYSYGKGYNGDVYRYCAGYQYDDSTIVGFSHTHFNGTGHSDLGDLLIMPTTGRLKLNPGIKSIPRSGYRSHFSHETEEAHPGYYSVLLDDYHIKAELSATEHVGMHKYTFPKSSDAHIILDLTSGIYNYDGKVVWSSLRMENDTLLTGWRQTSGWARTRLIYFAIAFSKPVLSYGFVNEEKLVYRGFWRKWNENENFPERAGRLLKAYFNFETKDGEDVLIKCAISGVSTAGALKNLFAEIPDWNFERVKLEAKAKWNKELSKIQISAGDERKINFYTALYHTFQNPVIFSDVDGSYRGLDQAVHQAPFTDYTIFSLWDTFRALHPLYTIIQQQRTSDIVNSMLAHYDESVHHILPIWSHWGNENWCMIGYHAVSVIADAYLKGIRGFDAQKALAACVASASYEKYDGIGSYRRLGYVPEDINTSSASKTLEYAYDDWTISAFAEKMGEIAIAKQFTARAGSYRNVFDSRTEFMRARRANGSWVLPFDPLSMINPGYIEGNAWNYSLFVPHDIKGFARLLGADEKLITWLDSLFTMQISDKYFAESEDVTRDGVIGNYVHGNEPSHHVAYMYCYLGEPWKTQERIHQIVDVMYQNAPDGLSGNDDCGQMSAWYIFSSIGFYPVTPGTNEYVIGSPCVREAKLLLENEKTFTIRAQNLSDKNIYIKEAILNGRKIDRCYILHEEIMHGGELELVMSPEPNKEWATSPAAAPYSMSKDQ